MPRAKWKAGDRCKIITPEFFVGCAYPVTVDSVLDEFRGHPGWDSVIRHAAEELGRDVGLHALEAGFVPDGRFQRRLERLVATQIAHKRFGGERRITTAAHPQAAGIEAVVRDVRYCKTGTYVSASGGGGDDYCPAYLDDQQTHCILVVDFQMGMENRIWPGTGKIEDVYVERL